MGDHYYIEEPTTPLKVKDVRLVLKNGHVYHFRTPSGVFGFGRIDRASRVLIENARIKGKRLLDVGCGYGVIGITLKKEHPHLELFMSDINRRAVEFAKINAKENNIEAEVRWGNLYEPWRGETFDMILSNPPITAGKRVWERLIREAPNFLNNGGLFQIVAFHNKGGRRLKEIMRETFGNAKEICKDGGIRVYLSEKVER
ncbi:MAG: rRNA (guanine1207-N2)-methyltransferase [Thermotogota bacterium]|nr:rRNA (guanine1207-N2)-methyltransferase [Thermotogota bacterium]MDK2865239.1 rRNA (guanine1207-N2)-methyltransferase [Thermotogota bacterium]